MSRTTVGIGAGAMALFMSAAPMALAQTAPPPPTQNTSDIIVTATRQATNIQKTPLQVTAFSGQKLKDAAVNSFRDITYLAPSVRYTSDSGAEETSIAMRGIGASAAGGSGPGVQVYEEEVPLAGTGLNTSPYDLADVQVLQGPQGTLFGRNTLAGAILTEPVLPSYQQNGYIKAGYGSYNYWTIEGAGNATILPDVLAVRVAAQFQRRDGYVTSLSAAMPEKQANLKTEAFRVSLLFTPTPNFKNVTTFDYYHEDDHGQPGVLVNPLLNPLAGPNAAVLAACHHRCIDYGPVTQGDIFFSNQTMRLFNTTTWDVTPNVELKNIFGWQDAPNRLGEDSLGGVVPSFVAQGIFAASRITEEAQIIAHGFDNRLEARLGGYYEHDWTHGPSGSRLPFFPLGDFSVLFGHAPGTDVLSGLTASNGNKADSYAVYGDLSFAVTEKLKIHGGYRYTWDSQTQCNASGIGGAGLPPFVPAGAGLGAGSQAGTSEFCFASAAAGLPGARLNSKSTSAPSWAIGLDYQVTPSVFLYFVTRRGYRSAPLNQAYTGCLTGVATGPGLTDCHNDLGLALGGAPTGHTIDLRALGNLQSETITDFEVGARTQWHMGDMLARLNVTYYHYDYNNVADRLALGAPTPVVYDLLAGCTDSCQNETTFGSATFSGGKVRADGVQADLGFVPTKDLSFDFNVSYLNQKGSAALPPIFNGVGLDATALANLNSPLNPTIGTLTSPTPPWAFTIAARYVMPFHPLNGDVVLAYNYFWTDPWFTQGVQVPGYDLHNLRVDWNNIGGSNVSAGVWVRNLLDKDYIISAVNIAGGVANYGEPRMVGFDVTAKFH